MEATKQKVLQPIHDRIIFDPIPMEESSVRESGLIVYHTNMETSDLEKGLVLYVGTGKPYDKGILPMTVKVGDIIIFNKKVPFYQIHNGKRVGSLRESDVMSIEKDA